MRFWSFSAVALSAAVLMVAAGCGGAETASSTSTQGSDSTAGAADEQLLLGHYG